MCVFRATRRARVRSADRGGVVCAYVVPNTCFAFAVNASHRAVPRSFAFIAYSLTITFSPGLIPVCLCCPLCVACCVLCVARPATCRRLPVKRPQVQPQRRPSLAVSTVTKLTNYVSSQTAHLFAFPSAARSGPGTTHHTIPDPRPRPQTQPPAVDPKSPRLCEGRRFQHLALFDFRPLPGAPKGGGRSATFVDVDTTAWKRPVSPSNELFL